MIDQAKKKTLIETIKHRQESRKAELLLPPELYFDGYEDDHCTICANIRPSISTARFAERLRAIRGRPDVAGVFVRFYDYSDAEEFESCWIGSDSIYVITTAPLDVVQDWFVDLEVSDVWEERDLSKFEGLPIVPDGFHLVAVWWD
jgi:hypothetical protein